MPPIIEKEEEQDTVEYYNWLEEGGFLYKDKKNNVKVKDGAPQYLEFNKTLANHVLTIMDTVDANYDEIMDVVDIRNESGDDDALTLEDIHNILSIRIEDRGWDADEYEFIYTDVSADIVNNISTNINYDNNGKLIGFDVYAYEGDNQTGRGNGYRYGGKDYT
jgi:hypothetical protein